MNLGTHPKVLNLQDLGNKAQQFRKERKKIVLCHGHFNVIHPGHLRFLNLARSIGDIVIVAVMGREELAPENRDSFFPQAERANALANLELVDLIVETRQNILQVIESLGSIVFLKGKEFEDQIQLIQKEKDLVEKLGGKVVFSSGDIEYEGVKFFEPRRPTDIKQNYSNFLSACEKHDVQIEAIKSSLDTFQNLNILVIGDTIVDNFVACDALGLSSEAPVVVLKELESKQFMGGAAIISQHVRSLGAQCTYASVLGIDEPANFVEQELNSSGIKNFLIRDESRPTTYKTRYVVGHQKILRVSRLSQHSLSKQIEEKFCDELQSLTDNLDGLIISDFVYGMITPKMIERIQELKRTRKFRVFGDTQCSSQFGDVSKFRHIDLITPTEKEARIAMNDQSSGLEKLARDLMDKTHNENLVITLGSEGILVFTRKDKEKNSYQSDFFCALEENPIDVSGAGDAMLTGYCLGLCSGLNIMQSSLLASCLSAVSIMRMGNIPIKSFEVIEYLDNLLKYQRTHSH